MDCVEAKEATDGSAVRKSGIKTNTKWSWEYLPFSLSLSYARIASHFFLSLLRFLFFFIVQSWNHKLRHFQGLGSDSGKKQTDTHTHMHTLQMSNSSMSSQNFMKPRCALNTGVEKKKPTIEIYREELLNKWLSLWHRNGSRLTKLHFNLKLSIHLHIGHIVT